MSYQTAHRWFSRGLIDGAIQLPTGTILVHETNAVNSNVDNNSCVIYCRVSSPSRKKDLESQVLRCEEFCRVRGYSVSKIYKEVASGMNDKRRELTKLLDSNPAIIVVEHKDRLTRFGFNYLESLLSKLNCKIVVINEAKDGDEEDLMKDMISIVTSFCCRLYGLRRSRNRINKIKQVLENEDEKDNNKENQ